MYVQTCDNSAAKLWSVKPAQRTKHTQYTHSRKNTSNTQKPIEKRHENGRECGVVRPTSAASRQRAFPPQIRHVTPQTTSQHPLHTHLSPIHTKKYQKHDQNPLKIRDKHKNTPPRQRFFFLVLVAGRKPLSNNLVKQSRCPGREARKVCRGRRRPVGGGFCCVLGAVVCAEGGGRPSRGGGARTRTLPCVRVCLC